MRLACPLSLAVIVVGGACNGSGPVESVDSALACDCPQPAADEVSYENLGSGLAGTDVQRAIDELAARPAAPSDAFTRIASAQESITAGAGGAFPSATVLCPGSPPDLGLALGGSCSGGDETVHLQGTLLQANAFRCDWLKPLDATPQLTASVTCLLPQDPP
jgi:hypothetical protein